MKPRGRTTLIHQFIHNKSRIRETSNLSTDADRRTDTILERLRDLSIKKKNQKKSKKIKNKKKN